MGNFYDEIATNKRNSYFLVFLVFVLTFAAAYAISLYLFEGDIFGTIISVALSAIYITVTYFYSDRLVLSLSGAREAKKGEFPYLLNTVEGLSIAAGIPMPKVYVMDEAGMNAFAVGTSPEKASVAFTTGLLSSMNRAELEGVAAHEISHIKNYDSRLATLVVVMVGLMAILSDICLRSMFWNRKGDRGSGGIAIIGLVIIILAPIIAQLVRLALSRQREYLADASGAQLTRYPTGLASALEKISKSGSIVNRATETTASLYFANPISMTGLLSTHPPVQERIKRLRSM